MICETHKGIILAGGSGTRLGTLTKAVSKQLLPVYDKPMIYYPLSLLIRIGIEDILIITNPEHLEAYKTLLKDGQQWGIRIQYHRQESPRGLPDAYILAESYLERNFGSIMVLGDNLFYGDVFWKHAYIAATDNYPCAVFGYPVGDPKRYGVAEWQNMNFEDYELPAEGWRAVKKIEEKPHNPKTRYAVPGLYVFDKWATKFAMELNPSARGELEIADLINHYASRDQAHISLISDNNFWFDCGTPDTLMEASQFISAMQHRLGKMIGCPLTASNDFNR